MRTLLTFMAMCLTCSAVTPTPGGPQPASGLSISTFTATNPAPVDVVMQLFAAHLTYPRIRHGGIWNAVMIQPGSGTMDVCFYNTNTFVQSAVSLTGASIFAVDTNPAFDVVGTNLILAGIPSGGGKPSIFQYPVSTNFMPNGSLTSSTNWLVNDTNALRSAVDTLSNGGVAIAFWDKLSGDQFNVTYRRPDGTWTNYPTVTTAFGGSDSMAALTSAQMLGDNSWWLFYNRDGSGTIWALKFAITGTDLTPVNSFIFADTSGGDSVWGNMAPRGEICAPQAISDTTSNRLLLVYNNDQVQISTDPNNNSVTHLVLVGMNANTNRYIIGNADHLVYSLFDPHGVSQTASGKMTYSPSVTFNVPASNPMPYTYESYSGESQNPSANTPYQVTQSSFWAFYDHANHVIIRNINDLSYHLLVYP